ncbi:MAG: GNAT family N-acetyltransferase [Burkholderiaceae bacterium]
MHKPGRSLTARIGQSLINQRRLTIRRATPRDLPELLRLNIVADEHNHELVPDIGARRIDTRRSLNYWKRSLRHWWQAVWVADLDGGLLAVIGVDLRVTRHRFAPIKRHVYLHSLWVEPQARRLGLARRLTRTALAWGQRRGATQARLEAASVNASALRLYESLGFASREVLMARPIRATD